MEDNKADLNDRQLRFCEEYLIDLNATQAAIRAGYSANSAGPDASRMLTYAHVQDKIAELQKKRSEKTEITANEVLTKLKRIADAQISDYITFDGTKLTFKDFSGLTKEQLEAVESIKEGKYGIELKLHGKSWTLDMISKHIGFYEKDNEQQRGTVEITREIINGDQAKA